MRQEVIDFGSLKAVFGQCARQCFFYGVGNDVFVQQFHILLDRHHAAALAFLGIDFFPADKAAVAHFAAGIHAHRHFVGVGHQLDPADFQADAARVGTVAKMGGAGTVGEHPAQEVFFKSDFGAGVFPIAAFDFGAEVVAAHHRRGAFGCDGNRMAVLAAADALVGIFHRRHARHAHAGKAGDFTGRGVCHQAVHHHAVAGQDLVGIGRAAA